MKAQLTKRRQTSKESVAISVVFHVFAIAAIASITFRYPLAAFFGLQKEKVPVERIQYVKVEQPKPKQSVGNGAGEKREPKKAAKPAPLLAPTLTPTTLPPIAPP